MLSIVIVFLYFNMRGKHNNILTLIKRNVFVIVLFSMVVKPLHVFTSTVTNILAKEIVKKDFDNWSDTDTHQEDEQNEVDTEEDSEEELKMFYTVENYSFSILKIRFLTEFLFRESRTQDIVLLPPDCA